MTGLMRQLAASRSRNAPQKYTQVTLIKKCSSSATINIPTNAV